MRNLWILVADSSAARIYSAKHLRADLELVESLEHKESRMHPRDRGSDVPGRVHDRFGPARHSVDNAQQVKAEERSRFAREIAGTLVAAHQQQKFDQLVVMAAPTFLGVLRGCIGKPLARAIVAEVPKDLVGQDVEAIKAHLP